MTTYLHQNQEFQLKDLTRMINLKGV